jgi:outer membrane protein OmpA-like peptidoglycan-associated protein
MILFDFSKADIVGNNKKIMDIVKSRLKPESEILITGYADRTGEAEFNQSLSDKRANAASKILGHKKSTAKGIGNNILIYDNDIPEGRFYCRTVNIRIETPID